jgi:uncharacterized protein YjiS (DUF1127 family)
MPHPGTRTLDNSSRARQRQNLARNLAALPATLARYLTTALARRRDRALLARLDPHLLKDIGVSSTEASRECAKPFWQP